MSELCSLGQTIWKMCVMFENLSSGARCQLLSLVPVNWALPHSVSLSKKKVDINNSMYFMKLALLHGLNEVKYIICVPQEVFEEMYYLWLQRLLTYSGIQSSAYGS